MPASSNNKKTAKKIPGGSRFFKQGSLLTVKNETILRQTIKAPSGLSHRPGITNVFGVSGNPGAFLLFPEPAFSPSGSLLSSPACLRPDDTFLVLSKRPRWLDPGSVRMLDNYAGFRYLGMETGPYNFFWYAVKVLAEDKVGWVILLNDKSPKSWFEKAAAKEK